MANVENVQLTVQDKAIHCAGCEARIVNILKRLPGVLSVKADHKTQKVQLAVDTDRLSVQALRDKMAAIGYETAHETGP